MGVAYTAIQIFAIPTTPHAERAPAFPVVLLSSWPPFPRSSGSA